MEIRSANATQVGKPVNAIDKVIERVNGLVKQANLLAERAARVGDRALGSRGEPIGQTGNPRAVRNGSLGALEDHLDDLEGALGAQAMSIDRLDTFV